MTLKMYLQSRSKIEMITSVISTVASSWWKFSSSVPSSVVSVGTVTNSTVSSQVSCYSFSIVSGNYFVAQQLDGVKRIEKVSLNIFHAHVYDYRALKLTILQSVKSIFYCRKYVNVQRIPKVRRLHMLDSRCLYLPWIGRSNGRGVVLRYALRSGHGWHPVGEHRSLQDSKSQDSGDQ